MKEKIKKFFNKLLDGAIYKRCIFEKHYSDSIRWSDIPIFGYIQIFRIWDIKGGLRYCVNTVDLSYCCKKKEEALLITLENADIDRLKYDSLKDRIKALDLWDRISF